jgi:hypothetical protein
MDEVDDAIMDLYNVDLEEEEDDDDDDGYYYLEDDFRMVVNFVFIVVASVHICTRVLLSTFVG